MTDRSRQGFAAFVRPVVPALVAALAAAAVAGCSGDDAAKQTERPPVLVRVAKAERGNVPYIVRAPGLVMPSETVEVQARVDSQVMEVHFKEGDRVEVGQLLFTLDDRTISADLKRQEAMLATSEAEQNNAKRQYARARELAAGGFQSTAELDKTRADSESGDARVAATAAEIERLKVLLGYTKITAAIDGRAGVINATVGNTVKANDPAKPLVVINRISPIRIRLGLPQQVLEPLRQQMKRSETSVRVILDGLELPEPGDIEFVDNNVNRSTGTFECRAEFRNESEALWPGMIVELLVQLGEDTGVVSIPELAVQHGPSGDYVFLVVDSKAVRRPLKVRRYGEGLAIVDEGLKGGESVAVDGMLSLSEGSPVQISGPKAAEPDDSEAGSKRK